MNYQTDSIETFSLKILNRRGATMRFQALIIALIGVVPLCSANPNEFLRFACQSFSGMFGNKCFEEDGAWGMWGPFTACSLTCGTGTRNRTRECDNPPASNGGAECPNIDTDNIDIEECNTSPCPVDGGWGSWGEYSPCSGTCGGGTRTRERVCDNPSASHGGASCSEVPIGATESEDCGSGTCGVNGNWGVWSGFSPCTESCGGGTQERTRNCDDPPPSDGGAECPNKNSDSFEKENCNTFPCPVDGGWGSWGPYTPCSATCGGGTYSRTRSCNDPSPSNGGQPCSTDPNDATESDACNTFLCPVNGGWAQWTDFNKCSKSCGAGTRERTRKCNNPLPSNGGADCPRSQTENEEFELCNTSPCPVNGGWGKYGEYTPCTNTCGGGGLQTRYRVCDSPRPSNGGEVCAGNSFEQSPCNENPCPVNGNWGSWENFKSCSQSCGGGTRERERVCNKPSPANGGADCPNKNSDSFERENCNTFPCAVNGEWGSWGAFSPCTVTCAGGQHFRQRLCNNPSPTNGGMDCDNTTESSTNVQNCNNIPCPVDGEWGEWAPYGECTATCGGGTQQRTRLCNSPAESSGGASCPSSATETQICNTMNCFELKCLEQYFVYDAVNNFCIQLFTQFRTYDQALAVCQENGARLAIIYTPAKFGVAKDIIVNSRTDQTDFYLGARIDRGEYKWVGDGRLVIWIGTPNTTAGPCVKMQRTDDGYQMNACACTAKQYHFCELTSFK